MQRLIADMAAHNQTWGEERIAAELRVKLGLTVSPRTVRRYMPSRPRGRGGRSAQSWATFLHNHAGAVLARDFFIVVTATFQPIRRVPMSSRTNTYSPSIPTRDGR
jgi:hypothetical protein